MYSATDKPAGTFPGIDRLLDYFHMERRSFPREIQSLEDAVELLNESAGLILVPTTLEGDWYRTAAGPLLVRDQAGMDLALLPDWLGRYYFYDEGTGRRVYITQRSAQHFPLAYHAAPDLPGAAITVPSLLGRMLRELSRYEGALLVLWGILGGGLWVLLAMLVHSALASVVQAADQLAFWGIAAAILLVALLEALLVLSGRQVIRRVSQKAALAALLGVGRRLYAAEEQCEEAAFGMAALRENGEQVMTWLLTSLWALLAALVALPFLWSLSPSGAAAAAVTALVLYGAAAAVLLRRTQGTPDWRGAAARRTWLLHQAADRRLGIVRPLPGRRANDQREYPLGAAWPLAALLLLPMVYLAIAGGFSAARLAQAVLLYLPVTAFPLAALLGAASAGRSMAALRALLPLAGSLPAGTAALPPMGSVFELKDVTVAYPGRGEPVLRGVNLRLHPGELVGIWGATGAGKTTLARLMTGLIQPTNGNVYYGGIELARYNGSALRRRIAYDRGTDILLCEQVPEQRDGRTCVVFSVREDALAGCDRVLQLIDGELING